jgi:hypothetical protein
MRRKELSPAATLQAEALRAPNWQAPSFLLVSAGKIDARPPPRHLRLKSRLNFCFGSKVLASPPCPKADVARVNLTMGNVLDVVGNETRA